jgi:nitroreductase
MNENFEILRNLISNRRTTKPQVMNGQKISDEQILQIIDLANFAPNHGLTEPWRFVVYSNENVIDFCRSHAMLYKLNTAPENFEQGKYDKLLHMGDMASHIIVCIMQRGWLPKIALWEEEAAVCCAIQNILIGATSLGIATYWGSGGLTRHKALKDFFKLNDQDEIMGILYAGYSDKIFTYNRATPTNEKTRWNPAPGSEVK